MFSPSVSEYVFLDMVVTLSLSTSSDLKGNSSEFTSLLDIVCTIYLEPV